MSSPTGALGAFSTGVGVAPSGDFSVDVSKVAFDCTGLDLLFGEATPIFRSRDILPLIRGAASENAVTLVLTQFISVRCDVKKAQIVIT